MIKTVCVLSMLLCIGFRVVYGCGLNDKGIISTTEYPGMDKQGRLMLAYPLGKIKFSDAIQLPITLCFNPSDNVTRSGFGKGWSIPLFDSAIIQTDEDEFIFRDPTGAYERLHRKTIGNTLEGVNWKGEFDASGNAISLYGCNGWSVRCVNGMIERIKHDNDVLVINFDSGQINVALNGVTVAKVPTSHRDGEDSAMTINNKTYRMKFTSRPLIAVVNRRKTIVGSTVTLSSLVWNDNEDVKNSYIFDFNVNADMNPIIAVKSERESEINYMWDEKSGALISDGKWYYQSYGNALDPMDISMIKRTLISNLRENNYKYEDPNEGITLVEINDGPVIKTTCFTSGSLFGRTHKVEQINRGRITLLYSKSYNELGEVIGISTPQARYRFGGLENNRTITFVNEQGEQWTKQYKNNMLESIIYRDGSKVEVHSENGAYKIEYHSEKRTVTIPVNPTDLDLVFPFDKMGFL